MGSWYEKWLLRQYPIHNNLALTATATALSHDTSTGQTADKANDGVLNGYAVSANYPADSTREWATVFGGAGNTLRLTWSTPQTINRIVLYDRPNTAGQILNGNLSFSSGGTPMSLCQATTNCTLDNLGGAKVIIFIARTVTLGPAQTSPRSAARPSTPCSWRGRPTTESGRRPGPRRPA